MKPPEGHQDYKRYFWKLKKAIYGLKQSGREWNLKLNRFILKIGLVLTMLEMKKQEDLLPDSL